MSSEQQVRGSAHQYRPVGQDILRRRLQAADKPGGHIWMMVATWAISDPQAAATGAAGDQIMDSENLLSFGGPICYKCEREWSRKLAAQPCRGSLTDFMP